MRTFWGHVFVMVVCVLGLSLDTALAHDILAEEEGQNTPAVTLM